MYFRKFVKKFLNMKKFLKLILYKILKLVKNILILFFNLLKDKLKEKLKLFFSNLKILLLENKLLIIIIILITFLFFFLDLSSFFMLNVVIPENPEHYRIVLPNEIHESKILEKNNILVLPMVAEYPTDIIISETFHPHEVHTITYQEVLDFFYNEMKANEDFFETDLTIIDLYKLVVGGDVNYFQFYYYYYLFCYKLMQPLERYGFALTLDYSFVPTAIHLLRDKFLVMRNRKVLFFVLRQGLDLVLFVLKEKEQEYREKKKQEYQQYEKRKKEENKEKYKMEQEFQEYKEKKRQEAYKNRDLKKGQKAYKEYEKRKKKEEYYHRGPGKDRRNNS